MSDKKTKRMQLGPAVRAGLKVGLYVGAGGVAAMAGGRLARSIDAVAAFADTPEKGAIVDAAAGTAISAIGARVVFRKNPEKRRAALPFLVGGALLAAVAPVVGPRIASALDDLMARVLPGAPSTPPGGLYADPYDGLGGALPSAVLDMTPGGFFADEANGLGGRLPGGLFFDENSPAGNRLPSSSSMPSRI